MDQTGGMGLKPSDAEVIPICPTHHNRLHSTGERAFWDDLKMDPRALAALLWYETTAGKEMP